VVLVVELVLVVLTVVAGVEVIVLEGDGGGKEMCMGKRGS